MPITLPPFVAPNEIIESAWGNAVVDALDELDDEKFDAVGGTITGSVTMEANLALTAGSVFISGAGEGVNLPTGEPSAAARAARKDYIDSNFVADAGGTMSGTLTMTQDPANGAGAQIRSDGVIQGSLSGTGGATTATPNLNLGRGGTPGDNGGVYASLRRSASSTTPQQTQIGSITVATASTVAFNTSSDERLKTVLRDLDDDEVATILRLIAPVVFAYNVEPDVEHIGFIAQQLAATWPTFVDVGILTPGYGEPGDPDTEHELEDGTVVVELGFVPWQIDLSKFTPLLVAGWQALDRRLAVLEGDG